ncbi:hypothetical protein SPRG_18737, partial [Saprolegnia parasitica CBS 223.65]
MYASLETPSADAKVHVETNHVDDEVVAAYAAPGAYLKACVLRTVMVVVMVIIAIIWKDHFSDLLDFVGASSTALSCMILPIVFYLKTFRTTLS